MSWATTLRRQRQGGGFEVVDDNDEREECVDLKAYGVRDGMQYSPKANLLAAI